MGFDPVSYLMGSKNGGGGGGVTVEPLSVAENGTYTAPSGKAYSPVTVFNSLEYITQMTNAFAGAPIPRPNAAVKLVEIYAPECTNIQNAFQFNDESDFNGLHIKVTCGKLDRMMGAFATNGSAPSKARVKFQKITLITDTSNTTYQSSTFQNQEFLEEIGGTPLHIPAGANVSSMFGGCTSLKEIRFAPNGVHESISLNQSSQLSSNSLVSLGNGLSDSASAKSITLHSDSKTLCGQIVGTVSDGVFTQDDTGSVTLTDFITNTKGWTLA